MSRFTIIPQSEDGPDTEDNAAPLCPSCHETFGANPDKRKFIREVRDFWYELCAKQYSGTSESMKIALADALKNIATKEDLEQLTVWNSSLVLGSTSAEGKIALDHLRYSFVREEYIHPLILRELNGWGSDKYSPIIGIDLEAAHQSDQFYGDIKISDSLGRARVTWAAEKESCSYSYIATSPSGVHMVEFSDWSGGSGVFGSVMLLAFNQDRCLARKDSDQLAARDRILIKLLGQISLGDRYSGAITYNNGLLTIGPDEGWFQLGERASQRILIQ